MIAKLIPLPVSILVYTYSVQAGVERHPSHSSFGCLVHNWTPSCLQVTGAKRALTALGFLSLLICCRGQWGFASSCAAVIRLEQVFASNVTGNYIGMLDIVSPRLRISLLMRARYIAPLGITLTIHFNAAGLLSIICTYAE